MRVETTPRMRDGSPYEEPDWHLAASRPLATTPCSKVVRGSAFSDTSPEPKGSGATVADVEALDRDERTAALPSPRGGPGVKKEIREQHGE